MLNKNLLAAVTCLFLFTMSSVGQTDISYDKFQDHTRIATTSIPITPGGKHPILFHKVTVKLITGHKGQKLQASVPSFYFFISVESSSWLYLRDTSRRLIILADNFRITSEDAEHDGEIINRGVSEHLFFDISYSNVQKILNATSVEVQAGPLEFVLSDDAKAKMKAVFDAGTVANNE